MPTYEYQCKNCKREIEVFQKITDDALTRCPKCGKDSLSRLISGGSFQLKGTGWYVTDFKDKPKAKPAAEAETKIESKSKTETKT